MITWTSVWATLPLYSESGMAAVKTTAPPLDTELLSALRVTGVPVALLAGVITVVTSRKSKEHSHKGGCQIEWEVAGLRAGDFCHRFFEVVSVRNIQI